MADEDDVDDAVADMDDQAAVDDFGDVQPTSDIKPEIQLCRPVCPLMPPRNVVSTVNLGCKLELKTIAQKARNAEYSPKVRRACTALTA
jgi:hypothetical protein